MIALASVTCSPIILSLPMKSKRGNTQTTQLGKWSLAPLCGQGAPLRTLGPHNGYGSDAHTHLSQEQNCIFLYCPSKGPCPWPGITVHLTFSSVPNPSPLTSLHWELLEHSCPVWNLPAMCI